MLVPAWLLAGCGKDIIKFHAPPEVVKVTIREYVSLCPEGGADCALLRDCYNEEPREQSYAEAKRLANLRDASIDEDCNKRWAKVRALQPKAKEK